MPKQLEKDPARTFAQNQAALDYTLEDLMVFDRLEVGPVQVEARRIKAPYRLLREGQEDSKDLIYAYEEQVFDPSEPVSQNLASMISAQVALNYGLFCKEIVFHGTFDDGDRRFLKDMAENTAREIWVKKFLEPNPFLIGAVSQSQPVKRRKYLNAELLFPDAQPHRAKAKWHLWEKDRSRHCILSSGGKDSLLSYGLCNEIGTEVHPIFVNESGRHWFTALNAYRYFQKNVPNTARVWVNSDRIFTWMLGRMPFIRKNFSDIRSDEYPIRLWTVAVFLFGVLPLMRKRSIGRLIIGDEFDTTVPSNFKGIKHFDGLYDQSIYFDNTLSRFFLRKGWAISQFSILRPLSELLIEKILWERYPALQEHQTSCHATHKADDRVIPCGKCEKCRRIVAMLTAIGADPERCGYTASQVQRCVASLTTNKIHQEEAGVQHLMSMLADRRMIGPTDAPGMAFKAHPEILSLRFDPKKSPVSGIPVDLREPLYRICLKHADGAVRRSRNRWTPFELFSAPEMIQAYPYEIDAIMQEKVPAYRQAPPVGKGYLWGELTWPEAAERLKDLDVALLPVGSVEQHGPHLPLDTDAFDADYLAKRVAAACSDPKPLVLPPVHYGVSYHHDDFPGTVSISNDTLARLTYEIGISLARNGIKKLVVINGHGGNTPALNHAAQMINRDAGIFVCVDSGETSDVDIHGLIETPNDVHAGEMETSTSLAVRPELVRMDHARKSIPKFSSRYLNFSSKRSVAWYGYTKKISASGVMGDPTKADVRKGRKIWEIMIAHLAAFVEDLKRMTLDEIHHQRF